MAEKLALTPEEIEAIASVTLPVAAYDVRKTTVDDIDLVVIPMELKDVNGESFYIQPFFVKRDAEALAEAILDQTKEN